MNPKNRKNDDRSDKEIARLVQEGEKELFGIIIDRYEDKLTRYGWRFFKHQGGYRRHSAGSFLSKPTGTFGVTIPKRNFLLGYIVLLIMNL